MFLTSSWLPVNDTSIIAVTTLTYHVVIAHERLCERIGNLNHTIPYHTILYYTIPYHTIYRYSYSVPVFSGFTYNRMCMKLFKSSNVELIKEYQRYFCCLLPSLNVKERYQKFISKYKISVIQTWSVCVHSRLMTIYSGIWYIYNHHHHNIYSLHRTT